MPPSPTGLVLVTGASSGIGRELALRLVRDRGRKVLATARRVERLESLAREAGTPGAAVPGGSLEILAGDIADPEFRDRLWKLAADFPGGVEILVNNAGIGVYGLFEEVPPEATRNLVEVNLVAVLDLTARAVAHMKERGAGQIVQVSSVLGFFGMPYSATYAATKHALNGLVKSLRHELRGTGVRVWAACPSQTVSEFHATAGGRRHQTGAGAGEPTERIVANILRDVDRGGARGSGLRPSSLAASLIVAFSRWLPAPFDWAMSGPLRARFASENLPPEQAARALAPPPRR